MTTSQSTIHGNDEQAITSYQKLPSTLNPPDMEDNNMNKMTSPEKKSLTRWSLDRMPPCQLPPSDEFSPVEHYVTVAITACNKSEEKASSSYLSGYNKILDCIRKRNDPPMLWKILLALRAHSLSMICSNPNKHAQLLHYLLKLEVYIPPKSLSENPNNVKKEFGVIPVISQEEATRYFTDYIISDAYLHLLVGLVSANTVFLIPCLRAIWKNIIKDPKANASKTLRLHSTLATTLRLVPKARTELFPVIKETVPFRREAIVKQKWYAEQCFAILQYEPELHEEILRLLIEKCLEMDVEIKIDKGGAVSLEEKNVDELYGLDLDEKESQQQKKEEKKNEERLEVNEMADRLDTLMKLLMEHIHSYSEKSQKACTELFNMLLRIFNSSILTTHRSKYVQFLIFYVCGIQDEKLKLTESSNPNDLLCDDERMYREFAGQLINKSLLSPENTLLTRQSGVCYLASFIARASYVSPSTVCECVAALLRWGDAYINANFGGSNNKITYNNANFTTDEELWKRKMAEHSDFYNVCQAAYYIMCFRGKEAVSFYEKVKESHETNNGMGQDEDQIEFIAVDIGQQHWEKLCCHKILQPLKFCLESVRREFLFVAKVFHLLPKSVVTQYLNEDMVISNLMKKRQARSQTTPIRNQRKRRSISTPATEEKRRLREAEAKKQGGGGVGGLGKGSNPLDSFFPFDPCLLRLSHGKVEPYYKDWGGGIEIEIEESHSDNDQDVDDSSLDSDVSSSSSSSSDICRNEQSQSDDMKHMSFDTNGSLMEIDSINQEGVSFDIPSTILTPDLPEQKSSTTTSTKPWVTANLKRMRAQSMGSTGSW